NIQRLSESPRFWIPAFAGMTKSGGNDVSVATVTVRFRLCWNFGKLMNRHSRADGNLEFQCLKNLSEKTKTLPPSFPRKWESRNEKQQEFIGNDRN
ncbi:hypothetical protein, partial [Neisseria meningitidis]|uniref:hypothetical protein n=1 Tax=Neisseria meningitidis TaxID=487 RepID=UPI00077B9E41